MIQSTITRYFQKNIDNNVKKELMNCEEKMSIDIKKEMDLEVKGELILDWDEVDNCHGQIFDNVHKKYTPKVVLEKLPESVLRKYVTKSPASAKKLSKSRLKCPKCKGSYLNKDSLLAHNKYCGKERDMKCDHCSYKTRHRVCLISHLSRIHENGNKIESVDEEKMKKICKKCNKTAPTLSLTKCEKCFSEFNIHCAKCNKQFKRRSAAVYHWNTRCGVRGYFNCPKCDFKSVWRAKVVDHMKRTHSIRDSSEEFKNIEWLDLKHEREKSEANKYKCPKCAKTLESSRKLSAHIFACGGSECTQNSSSDVENRNRIIESEAIKCSTCGKAFSHIYSLNKHTRFCMGRQKIAKLSCNDSDVDIEVVDENEDLPVKPLLSADERNERYIKIMVGYCAKCQEDSPMELEGWRMRREVPCRKCDQTLLFKCKKCLITKIKFSNLKRHFDNVCDPQEEFKCTKCHYKSFIFTLLKGHYNTVHGTDNVGCKKCGAKFKSMDYLKRHLRRCGFGPKFQCAHCPYKAKQKGTLKGHIFRNHMGPFNIIDRGAKLHLNAFCSKCKKEQFLSARFKICKICKSKLYYKCKTCKNKYDVDDKNACIHVKRYLETIQFECKHCGKGTSAKKNSLAHERACGSNTMFKCRFCEYAAKFKHNTVLHEKVKHPHKF